MDFTPPTDRPWTLRARWLFPADGTPITEGRLTILGNRIVAVSAGGQADLDLGNAALLPGFVNAHTHLDLGMLHGQCPPTPAFTAWLKSVIAGRLRATPEQVQQAIADGIAACVRSGTTLVGDISAGGASWQQLAHAPLRSVVYYELLGLPPERAEQADQRLLAWLAGVSPTERCRLGVSPHAPYSVHRELYRRSTELVAGGRWATHLAESTAELELLAEQRGPFVDFLRDLNVWAPAGLVADAGEVVELSRPAASAALVHANYLPADSALGPQHTIVYCPRTHAAFGHPPHPFRSLLERGVRVALGTDSLASNPDLDILAEARFVHAQHPELPGETLLRMLTLNGASALGWDADTGSLTPGKLADVVVLPLPDTLSNEPYRQLWASTAPVAAVLCAGVWTLPLRGNR